MDWSMAKRSNAAPNAKPTTETDMSWLHKPVVKSERDMGIDRMELEHIVSLTMQTLKMELTMWEGQVLIWTEKAKDDPTMQRYMDEAIKSRDLFKEAIAEKGKQT
jgi:hypothetical protein